MDEILKIKSTIVTTFIGNIWKKGKEQVDYIKLQNTIKELSGLISTRDNDYNLHHANKVIHPTNSSKT